VPKAARALSSGEESDTKVIVGQKGPVSYAAKKMIRSDRKRMVRNIFRLKLFKKESVAKKERTNKRFGYERTIKSTYRLTA
jgi:hypothetical protein